MESPGRGSAIEVDAGSRRSDDSDEEYARQLEADLLSCGEESNEEEEVEGCMPPMRKEESPEGAAESSLRHQKAGGGVEGRSGNRERETVSDQEGPERSGAEAKPLEIQVGSAQRLKGPSEGYLLGCFAWLPSELLMHVMKFFSAEDLCVVARVNSTFRALSSDEGLWRSLYCNRWGPPPATDRRRSSRVRGKSWKQLYFERDGSEMRETLRNAPPEYREIYGQMAAAKRSQTPAVQQVHQVHSGDFVKVDTSVADQIRDWKAKQTFEAGAGHVCSGQRCSYHRIGDVFICERTGNIHVCDETCREMVSDPASDLLVCGISGRCFDRWVTPAEEEEAGAQARAVEEQDTYAMGGRLAQAYYLGYNCSDEEELDAALTKVMYSC
ncbi:hypothetical protein KFL_002320100 [Klebsormidium nitens]|uniref:F-box domain-containing protein n=1 Tax=Klebsormidium nitens TaxID=105231 RepID=A0A1Y1I9K2_KLENI|nr:hypothetical protein KFL_002320100 [Klebsormidium nitens]|eukprot:GAQ85376.1 hypothetical protein KFL_002320100 [Klebsormidium nitens]